MGFNDVFKAGVMWLFAAAFLLFLSASCGREEPGPAPVKEEQVTPAGMVENEEAEEAGEAAEAEEAAEETEEAEAAEEAEEAQEAEEAEEAEELKEAGEAGEAGETEEAEEAGEAASSEKAEEAEAVAKPVEAGEGAVKNAVLDLNALPARPKVLMKTSMGDITIELYADKAPVTVKNFLAYVKDGFYDGTLIHRVVPGFVIQGGGYTEELYRNYEASRKATRPPIKNEADNGLKNLRYTLSMARTKEKDSATSQFFINLQDNPSLDHKGPDGRSFGYAVFGRVVKGMEVVDAIAAVPTRTLPPYMSRKEVPEKPVKILEVRYLGEGE